MTREHEDFEVSAFRRDQAALRAHYGDWGHFKSVEGWLPWEEGEFLELPIHQLLFRPPGGGPPPDPWEPAPDERQFFLGDVEAGTWTCRRDTSVTRPFAEVVTSADGIPIVVPEIQLLYKAKHHLDKDEHDFRLVRPRLSEEQARWLAAALERVHPGDPWVPALE